MATVKKTWTGAEHQAEWYPWIKRHRHEINLVQVSAQPDGGALVEIKAGLGKNEQVLTDKWGSYEVACGYFAEPGSYAPGNRPGGKAGCRILPGVLRVFADDRWSVLVREQVAEAQSRAQGAGPNDWQEPGPDEDPDTESLWIYLGTVFALDPCGKYHHLISPNEITPECEAFWEDLEAALAEAGFSLQNGEGSATDVFAVKYREAGTR